MRYRVRQTQLLNSSASISVPSPRLRVRVATPVIVPTAPVARALGPRLRVRRLLAVVAPIVPPKKRRGRAPADIPDPWADLEWDSHVAAKQAVLEHPAGMTLEEIGAHMGITRERVRQIENSALRKLLNNTGGDITWLGGLTLATPDCKRCGEPFVRRTGRQVMCTSCEATRRRKRPTSAALCA